MFVIPFVVAYNPLMQNFPVLPADIELDSYHSSNSPYVKMEEGIKRVLVTQHRQMKTSHSKAATLRVLGRTNQEIAEAISVKPTTVSSIMNRDDVQTMIKTLRHLENHKTGVDLRKHQIWQIAVDAFNAGDGRLAIQANQELSRLEGAYLVKESPDEVIIDKSFFPKGALD